MFTLVIGLIVTGAGIVVAIRRASGAAPKRLKPATPMVRRDRDRSAVDEVDGTSGLRRARSGALLLAILTVLGAMLALLVVVGGAIVLTALRSAVQ